MADQDPKGNQGDSLPVDTAAELVHPEANIDPEPLAPNGLDGLAELSALATTFTLSDPGAKTRLDQIKESHALLRQFNPRELKILMNLKRNTSAKAWSLREDLVVLTLPMSNRELADLLNERNKEAVKKRLQLLRSKGLSKR